MHNFIKVVVAEGGKLVMQYFSSYYAVPIIRNDMLQKYPELEPTLNLLAGMITDSMMTELNYRADHLKHTPEKVAKDFLFLGIPTHLDTNGFYMIFCS